MTPQENAAPSNVVVLSGSAHPLLATAVARELGTSLGRCTIERFPDGESHLEIDADEVEGRDVMFVQPTSTLANEHIFELLLAADACRQAGATSLTAVVPYFGYARQDRRKNRGVALGARVAAKLFGAARFDHVVVLDLHGESVVASLDVVTEHLTAAPLLAQALEKVASRDAVVVAPDLGATRLARDYARTLRLPTAVVHKVRRSATEVAIDRVAGDVRGKRPILVDDIVSTGATLLAATRALREQGCIDDFTAAVTHGVFVPATLDRLRDGGIRRMFVTDTVALPTLAPFVTVATVAPLLASCVRRLAKRRHGAQYRSHP